MPLKENRGGKRVGAGRKKSAPTIIYRLSVDKELIDSLKSKLSTKEINAKIKKLLNDLNYNMAGFYCAKVKENDLQHNVKGQSELFCEHPRESRKYIGSGYLKCGKCDAEFK